MKVPIDAAELIARTRHLSTPFIWLTPSIVRAAVAGLRAGLPGVDLFYAVKCNPHPPLLRELAGLGLGFEVASLAEMRITLEQVPANRVMCLHPIKSPDLVRALHAQGVRTLAIDCHEELVKVAIHAPGSDVLVRVAVSNAGSRHPLDGKFGCPPAEAVRLLQSCADRGLSPRGVTMHVGTQCGLLSTWSEAIDTCRGVLAEVPAATVLSLGGGFPASYANDPADVPSVLRHVAESLPSGYRITSEPGRAIAADAGVLVATVTGTATRPDGVWAYLDAGIHQGLFESLPAVSGLLHPVSTEHPNRPTQPYTLAGPTCDAMDVIARGTVLPRLELGDRVLFHSAGAYSGVMASRFNSFEPPPYVWDE